MIIKLFLVFVTSFIFPACAPSLSMADFSIKDDKACLCFDLPPLNQHPDACQGVGYAK